MTRNDDARRLHDANRGVSFTVSYALTVAIATLLVAGVVLTAGFVLQEQREETIRDELQIVGGDLAATVMATDRLAVAGNNSDVTVTRRLPRDAVTEPYTISLRSSATETTLTLRTQSPPVTVEVPLRTRTDVADTSVTGGPVRIVYRSSPGELTLWEGDG